MKQTAVEWYNEQLNLYGDMAFNKEISLGQYHIKKQELFEQAKAMEKEQIIDAYETSHISMMTAEQYYRETFKQQEQ